MGLRSPPTLLSLIPPPLLSAAKRFASFTDLYVSVSDFTSLLYPFGYRLNHIGDCDRRQRQRLGVQCTLSLLSPSLPPVQPLPVTKHFASFTDLHVLDNSYF